MTLTVTPNLPRVIWVEPCPVRFTYTGELQRAVTFGPGRFGQHNVTVNDVEGQLAAFQFVESQEQSWRWLPGHIRRHDAPMSAYLSDVATRKVRSAFAELVPRLAETNQAAFEASLRSLAQEGADGAERVVANLHAKIAGLAGRAEVSKLVATGAAWLQSCETRPVQARLEPTSRATARAAIFTSVGRIGWAVSIEETRHRTATYLLPEHLVSEQDQ